MTQDPIQKFEADLARLHAMLLQAETAKDEAEQEWSDALVADEDPKKLARLETAMTSAAATVAGLERAVDTAGTIRARAQAASATAAFDKAAGRRADLLTDAEEAFANLRGLLDDIRATNARLAEICTEDQALHYQQQADKARGALDRDDPPSPFFALGIPVDGGGVDLAWSLRATDNAIASRRAGR